MTYSHLRPGNVVRWNEQVWIVIASTRKTVNLVSWHCHKVKKQLTSKADYTPIWLANNPHEFIQRKLST